MVFLRFACQRRPVKRNRVNRGTSRPACACRRSNSGGLITVIYRSTCGDKGTQSLRQASYTS